MAFYFQNTHKYFVMSEEDDQHYTIINNCRFCEKEIVVDKSRDHCHLTGKYRGPAHNKCTFIITQKQGFFPFVFHTFSNYDCHLFFKTLVGNNNDKVKIVFFLPKTNEEYIFVTYECTNFIDSYGFLPSSFDWLVKTLVDNSHKIL